MAFKKKNHIKYLVCVRHYLSWRGLQKYFEHLSIKIFKNKLFPTLIKSLMGDYDT